MARATGCALVLAVAVASGCGLDLQQICEDYHGCLGGSEQDIDACVRSYEMLQESADIQGCGEAHEEWLECDYEASTCQDEPLGVPCSSDWECTGSASLNVRCAGNECMMQSYGPEDPEACEQEMTAYDSCIELPGGIF